MLKSVPVDRLYSISKRKFEVNIVDGEVHIEYNNGIEVRIKGAKELLSSEDGLSIMLKNGTKIQLP